MSKKELAIRARDCAERAKLCLEANRLYDAFKYAGEAACTYQRAGKKKQAMEANYLWNAVMDEIATNEAANLICSDVTQSNLESLLSESNLFSEIQTLCKTGRHPFYSQAKIYLNDRIKEKYGFT